MSLTNVCQLTNPETLTFQFDPTFFDFDSIPPPALPSSYNEEIFKLSLQNNSNEDGIQAKLQEVSVTTEDPKNIFHIHFFITVQPFNK